MAYSPSAIPRPPVYAAELRRSFVLRMGMAAAAIVATLGLTVLAVRGLDAAEAATLLAILVALMLGPILGRLGLGTSAIRSVTGRDAVADGGIASAILWATMGSSLLFGLPVAYISTRALPESAERTSIVILVVGILVLESVRLTASDTFAILGDYRSSVWTTHHARQVAVGLVIGGALVAGAPITLSGILIGHVAVCALMLLVALWRLNQAVPLRAPLGFSEIPRAATGGLWFLVIEITAFVSLRGGVWLSGLVLSSLDATIYSTSALVALYIVVPVGLANVALAPAIARMHRAESRDQLRELVNAVSTLSAWFAWAATVGIVMFGEHLLGVVYGADMRAAAPLLAILAVGVAVFASVATCPILLMLSGHGRAAALVGLGVLFVGVPLSILVTVVYGATALAVVSSATITVLGIALWVTARHRLGYAPTPSAKIGAAMAILRQVENHAEASTSRTTE